MKIAISIPHQDFRAANWLASRSRKSRSELISDAVREYVARHAPESITGAMDRFCDEIDALPAAPNDHSEWLAFAPNNGEPNLATDRVWISQGQVCCAGHRALVVVHGEGSGRRFKEKYSIEAAPKPWSVGAHERPPGSLRGQGLSNRHAAAPPANQIRRENPPREARPHSCRG